MRVFEVALIAVNVLALLSVMLKSKSKATLLWLAGINGAVLGLHGAIEGFRYQMIFAYLFVGLFAVYALIRAKIGFAATKTKAAIFMKGTAVSLIFLSLAITTLLAYALPVFKLPAPTGDYAVGVQYVHLTDESRLEPFLADSANKRELAVKIYYPTEKDASRPYDAYFHNSPELVRGFANGYHMPGFLFDQLRFVRTHTQEGLPVSDKQSNYPVVLFSHGAGTNMEVHTSQCEDLASHGYIVVAVNHTYVSSATVLPGGIVTDRDATANFDKGDPLDAITEIMADDDSFVIDRLVDMNTENSVFAGKIDLQHIGVIGHSLGGAAAYNLAIGDNRIKAAINLDGAVYAVREMGKPTAPFLMLANDEFHIQAISKREPLMKKWEDMTADEQQAVASAYGGKQVYIDIYDKEAHAIAGLADTLKATGSLFTIEGSAHLKMSDIGLYIGPGFRRFIGINGATPSEQCLEMTKAVTLTFFNRNLKNDSSAATEALPQQYPKLHKVELS